MRVLVTGHQGYIGPSTVSTLQRLGHEVVGLDSSLFAHTLLEPGPPVTSIVRDLRDVEVEDLRAFDAIVHLAGLSNDPLGFLRPALTHEINVSATVRLATIARAAGVQRFVASSSCSVYGASSHSWVDEATPPLPITPYGESKLAAEEGLAALASDDFCVLSFRNATAFGYSPSLRTDLVVNDLTAGAYLRGEICLNSDGSAWRPLVHVKDIAQAFALALTAPADRINGEVVNIGEEEQNYTVLEIAQTVAESVPNAKLTIADTAGRDRRSYRVRFARVRELLPGFRCQHNLRAGIEDLVRNFRRVGLCSTEGCVRLAVIQRLLERGDLYPDLRYRDKRFAWRMGRTSRLPEKGPDDYHGLRQEAP
jgi:nucleoside-diphosphate-sugar epimerase